MNIPRYTAEASLYQSNNHYRSDGGSFLDQGITTVTPQGCGIAQTVTCIPIVVGGIPVCTASCLASPALGGLPCLLCWTAYLGGLYGFCRDCLPEWIRDVLDLAEGGGGG